MVLVRVLLVVVSTEPQNLPGTTEFSSARKHRDLPNTLEILYLVFTVVLYIMR